MSEQAVQEAPAAAPATPAAEGDGRLGLLSGVPVKPIEQAMQPEKPAEAAPASESSEPRPTWLPEKFKTPEDLSKAYAELEKAFHAKKEKLKEEIAAEMAANRPKSPDEYPVPEQVDIGRGYAFKPPADDPVVNAIREFAHKHGLPIEAFREAVELAAKMSVAGLPDPVVEKQKLGERADERLQMVVGQAVSRFGDRAEVLLDAIDRYGAPLFEIVEDMLTAAVPSNVQAPTSESIGSVRVPRTQQEAMELVRSPDYWQNEDKINAVAEYARRVAAMAAGG